MKIMGILNVTPDSFSDGGKFSSAECAVMYAEKMLNDGADIIDIGGESSRPGADEISVQEEIDRVIPVIEGLRKIKKDCPISIDTKKAKVAQVAVLAGANIINDISGLAFNENIADVANEFNTQLILMNMRGNSRTMQNKINLQYENVVDDVFVSLKKSAECAIRKGVKKDNIIIDPGIGFSKNTQQNIQLIAQIASFKKLGFKILVGPSKKKFIGDILNEENPNLRNAGTIGVALWLATQNIDIVRVHNVKEIKNALTMFEICKYNKGT